ncbi:MAG: sodium-translocating pyrophosphatase [Parcubacteria group bacterium]|nr:sodium-translocating pyrophosphatase [Parcubacteria group bacterium]
MDKVIYLAIGAALLTLLYGAYLARWIVKQPAGDEKMKKIASAIQKGSAAFLNRQYKTVALVAVVVSVVIYFGLGWLMAGAFLIGATASALAGYIGMKLSVQANVRTAEAAKSGLAGAFLTAFRGGSVTGLVVAGLALLVVAGFFALTSDPKLLIGLGFGASLISIFARLGGGIYTKAADVGADLVGKVEAGIPEDDPRNPAVIADNVGDNVGDCAGMAADLFETYVVTLSAGMLIGFLAWPDQPAYFLFPLALGALALFASLAGVLTVRLSKQNIMGALYKGLAVSGILSAALFYFAAKYLYSGYDGYWYIFASSLVGLAVTALIVVITDYYTSKSYRPVRSIAEASKSGHGTNIIAGLSVGMEATLASILVIVGGILLSSYFADIYGVAIAAVSMLSVAGMIIAIDAFGPITDNAGGIAEMSGLDKEVRKSTDALDAVGNTTKAVTKGYAIGSAGLAALALFSGYTKELETFDSFWNFSLTTPEVLIGLLLGAAVPYIFSSIAMKSVGRAAGAVVEEVRRQFREIAGIMEYKNEPDYGRAVDIVTKAALKEMVIPALIPVASVIAVGFLFGSEALGGFLIGSIVSGLFLAIAMTAGGAAWDNAKKYIEDGNFGGKGSEAHKAAVTGDTVGDPYKDTAGPAINPLIKVINIVALLIVPFL